jgi:ADP-heptose:LPS heptosyltransferase
MAPGGGRNPRDTVPEKRWGADGFAELVTRIRSRGMHTLLVGDGMDREAAARVTELAGRGGLTDLTGETGWGTAAALISGCRAFVGPDSGLAHLACAVGTPAVVLFGPTDPASLYHPSLVSPVRTDAECAPCYSNEVFRGCVRGECDCMFRIKPGTVWTTLERILDEDERS